MNATDEVAAGRDEEGSEMGSSSAGHASTSSDCSQQSRRVSIECDEESYGGEFDNEGEEELDGGEGSASYGGEEGSINSDGSDIGEIARSTGGDRSTIPQSLLEIDEEVGESDDKGVQDDDRGPLSAAPDGEDDNKNNTRAPRRKVKHRYCKAAVMMCVIWGTTVILISVALGMDWFNEGLYASSDDESLCTLCGDNGIDFTFNQMSPWPTRQPSASKSFAGTVDPPPDNLAQLCAPSIHLQYGLQQSGDLVENCMRGCFPALCCLVNNEEVKQSLLSLLGFDNDQASAYLSTVSDCYSGDDVPVCDAYNEWCATLYGLDVVLEESLPQHFVETCQRGEEDANIAATSRAFEPDKEDGDGDGDCQEICQPLACCYQNEQLPTNQIMRQRYRQHLPGDISYSKNEHRRLDEECEYFSVRDPLNAQICDAYAPFCGPTEYLLGASPSDWPSFAPYPSGRPSGVPTQRPSISSLGVDHSSFSPAATPQPSRMNATSNPSLVPSYLASMSALPTNETNRMSATQGPSVSRIPTTQVSATPFPPMALNDTGATASLSDGLNSSSPSSMPSTSGYPSGIPTVLNASAVGMDTSPSVRPSASPSIDTNVPSLGPTL